MTPEPSSNEAVRAVADDSRVISLMSEFDERIAQLSISGILEGAFQFFVSHFGVARASITLLEGDRSTFRSFDSNMPIAGIDACQILPNDSANLQVTVSSQVPIYRQDIRNWPTPNRVNSALMAAGIFVRLPFPSLWPGAVLARSTLEHRMLTESRRPIGS